MNWMQQPQQQHKGCGCGKKIAGSNASIPSSRRVTVYEVQVENQTVAEFESLPAARLKAVEVSGRVKVSSKVVNDGGS